MIVRVFAVAALTAVFALSGADAQPTAAVKPTPVADPATQALYRSECAGCHGERGDGKGLSDGSLAPLPRDFTRGKFKLRSTNPRQPVTVAEIADTISNGIPGTAMPSFRYLPDEQRTALAQMIRSFGIAPDAPPAQTVVVAEAPATTAELIANGRQQYEALGCPACHGREGKGDGPSAADLRDEWRNPAPPRNLIGEPFRGGESEHSIYLRLAIGMPGTPMPGYADVADGKSLWALTKYIASIRKVPALDANASRYGDDVFNARHCRACHQLGGLGGTVGPALDQVTDRRGKEWLASFLANPRPEPKVYPDLPYRMPQLNLTPAEITALIGYLGTGAGTN